MAQDRKSDGEAAPVPPLHKAVIDFLQAPSSEDAVRVFAASRMELGSPEVEALMAEVLSEVSQRNMLEAEALMGVRLDLFRRLRRASADLPPAGGATELLSQPEVREVLQLEEQRRSLPASIKEVLPYALSAGRRHRGGQDRQALDEALEAWGRVLSDGGFDQTPAAFQSVVLENAGADALIRYRVAGNQSDRDLAIDRWRRLVELSPPEDRTGLAVKLAVKLAGSYLAWPRDEELDRATEWLLQALQGASAAESAEALYFLGNHFRNLLSQAQNYAGLDSTIACHRLAVAQTALDDPNLPDRLDTLAIDLNYSFELGERSVLDEMIGTWEKAAELAGKIPSFREDYLADYRSNLGAALIKRYEIVGNPGDLQRATDCIEQAARQAPPDSPKQAQLRLNASGVRCTLFERTGDLRDLDRAIEWRRQALAALAPGTAERAEVLHICGALLLWRHQLSPNPEMLDEAIRMLDESRAVSGLHPQKLVDRSLALSEALRIRSGLTGEDSDAGKAIQVLEAVLALASYSPRRLHRVSNDLAALLRQRYERAGETRDLERAEDLLAKAATLDTSGEEEP